MNLMTAEQTRDIIKTQEDYKFNQMMLKIISGLNNEIVEAAYDCEPLARYVDWRDKDLNQYIFDNFNRVHSKVKDTFKGFDIKFLEVKATRYGRADKHLMRSFLIFAILPEAEAA